MNTTNSKKNGVVNALIIDGPDLTLVIKFQNILNYFIECINAVAGGSSTRDNYIEHLSKCMEHIKEIDRSDSPFNIEIRRTLKELIEQAEHFINIAKTFSYGNTSDKATELLLIKKASSLQWLSVLILEELKKKPTHS